MIFQSLTYFYRNPREQGILGYLFSANDFSMNHDLFHFPGIPVSVGTLKADYINVKDN